MKREAGLSKGGGSEVHFLFEEIIEVGDFAEAQGPGNFGDIPLGIAEEYPGFLKDPFGDDVGGGFIGRFFDRFVQVVYVDG